MSNDAPNDAPVTEGVVTDEELALAEENLQEGKALIDEDPNKAVELLCSVVKTFEKRYGGQALECADPYLQYGVALYEVARLSTDALGSTKTAVEDKKKGSAKGGSAGGPSTSSADADGAGPSSAAPQGEAPKGPDAEEGDGAGDSEEGADREAAGEQGADEGGADGEGDGEGDGDGEEGTPSDDMQLSWEMLELARVIYEKHDPAQHRSKLGGVHKALGDIHNEQERFEDAIACYKQAVEHLQAMEPVPRRRLAEVQYMMSLALTYMEQPEEALQHTHAALRSLEAAVAELDGQLSGLPEEAEEEGQALQATIDDLRGVMQELSHNAEGLQETIKHNNSLKEVLRNAMQQAAGAMMGGAAAAEAPKAAAEGGTTTSGFGAASSAAAASTPACNLGTVGRGTKRINLQPTGAAAGSAAGAPGAGAAGKSKRSLADLMGGPPGTGGVTTVGFGAPAVAAKPAAAAGGKENAGGPPAAATGPGAGEQGAEAVVQGVTGTDGKGLAEGQEAKKARTEATPAAEGVGGGVDQAAVASH